jgi:hypothetical protein
MKTYEVLEKALRLIEDEKNWCQGYQRIVEKRWFRKDRVRYCALGAVAESIPGENGSWPIEVFHELPEVKPLSDLVKARGFDQVGRFNNVRTHAEVVALFQEAIRNEKEKAGVVIDLPVETTA